MSLCGIERLQGRSVIEWVFGFCSGSRALDLVARTLAEALRMARTAKQFAR